MWLRKHSQQQHKQHTVPGENNNSNNNEKLAEEIGDIIYIANTEGDNLNEVSADLDPYDEKLAEEIDWRGSRNMNYNYYSSLISVLMRLFNSLYQDLERILSSKPLKESASELARHV